jgi:hypothetical protein
MKVFISWSGTRSREIAECLKDKLSLILQTTTFFVSSKDINSGTLWRTKVAEELLTSEFGIICLTKDVISKPWILFEAGALSNKKNTLVVPLCFGFSPLSIPFENPLSAYQGAEYSEGTLKDIIGKLNSLSEYSRPQNSLNKLFELIFPSLNKKIQELISLTYDNTKETTTIVRTYEDIISEFQKSNAPKIVKSLLSWGYDISKNIRTNQTYDFVMEDTALKKDGSPAVRIRGTHKYTVVNHSDTETLILSFNMRNELGLQSVEDCWGFEKLFHTENNGEKKEDTIQLVDYGNVEKKNLPLRFKTHPGESITFEFISVGVFLPSDKYIWYSQEFCEDCKISVINNTSLSEFDRFQINHRNEDSIKRTIPSKGKHIEFTFNADIFPREGFTMYWKEKSKETDEVCL